LLYSGVILAFTVFLFTHIPKGFLESEDTGQLSGSTEAQEGISFDAMVEHQKQVAAVVAADPNVDAFMSSVGGRGGGGYNQGNLFLRLKPRRERKLDADRIIEGLRPKLARIPGVRVFLQNPPPIRVGGQQSRSAYQFTLQATDTGELYDHAQRLMERMRDLPGLQDVTSDLQIRNPEVDVVIDRDRASALGVSVERVEASLARAFASGEVSTIYAPGDEYSVILELLPEYRADPAALSLIYLRSDSGKMVPLSAVAEIRRGIGPASINHLGQLPAVTLSFNLKPGVSLGEAVTRVQRLARDELPVSISTSFQGTAQAFQSSMRGLGLLLVLAILVIYLVLGILYESFIHPLTILSALPFAGFGALLTLLLFHVDLGLYAFVGVIMLVGLVKKNGIMMIDFALEAQRNEGKSPPEAIFEACLVRFRPIMMTTMAALMGTLPIAIGLGAGAESRRPLGLAVVGGLIFSQMLTLFVTPVFYIYMDAFQRRLRRMASRLQGPGPAAAK
jgi:HAE1 family hydrophobic/amphiphilic exporter-1